MHSKRLGMFDRLILNRDEGLSSKRQKSTLFCPKIAIRDVDELRREQRSNYSGV